MLTNIKIKTAKTKDKVYKMFDTNGLYIEIRPSGKKIWRVKYSFNGKEKTKTIGDYPFISLQKAREEVFLLKSKLRSNGIVSLNFKEVVKEFLKNKKSEWSEKHYKDQIKKLENYVFDIVENKNIDEITKTDINEVLNNVVKKNISNIKTGDKIELRKKIFLLLRQILRFATHKDYIKYNVCDSIDIKEILPRRNEEHIRAITDEKEFKKLVKIIFDLEGAYKITVLAVKFLVLSALRSGNVRKMEWNWVSFENNIVVIPAKEMKTKKEFRVPLTKTLRDILLQAKEMKKSNYVFYSPADKNKPLSESIFIVMLKRAGINNHKPHGFRSSFSTLAYEHQKQHGFSSEVIETQLSHSVGNKVTRAYMRSDFLEERRGLMEWWERFILLDN